MSVKAEITRDEQGFPTLVDLIHEGNKLTVAFDKNAGFTVEGNRRSLNDPLLMEYLKLIYPATERTAFNIPQPLQVAQVSGGKTVLFDDMEGLLKWSQVAGTVALDNTFAYNASQSLKVTCGAADTIATARRDFPLPPSGKLRLECLWTLDSFVNLNYLGFEIVVDAGIFGSLIASIRYDGNNSVWQYYAPGAAATNIQSANILSQYYTKSSVSGAWHNISFEVDFQKRLYGNLTVNQNVYDLSYFQFGTIVTGGHNRNYVSLVVNNDAGLEVNGWFDDFKLTDIG